MDPRTLGLVGGILGGVLGVLGGLVGSYFSIVNTDGPRERAFMVRVSALFCVGIAAFLLLLGLTPQPLRPLVWLPYLLALPLAIRVANQRQEQIRREEALDAMRGATADPDRDGTDAVVQDPGGMPP